MKLLNGYGVVLNINSIDIKAFFVYIENQISI